MTDTLQRSLESTGKQAEPTEAARTRRALKRHREMLGVSLFVVVVALLLQVLPGGERVAVRGLSRWPMPHSCVTRAWFGWNCPACGLTRSIVHLAHADWSASIRTHRLGWLFALAIVLQVPYRLVALRRDGRPPIHPRFAEAFGVFLIVVLIGNWLFDLLR